MSKKSKRYLSFILSMSLMFTSLFTGVVFAEEKAADSLESYIAQFEENPVTTQSAITYNLVNSGVKAEGSSQEAAGLWVDATQGKFDGVTNSSWAQVNDNTVFYVPVNGESVITINSYAAPTYLVQDITEKDSDPNYWQNELTFEKAGENSFIYGGKSETVIKVTVKGASYLKTIKVKSEGVQEGEVQKTWEKRDFSLKINGTSVNVEGAPEVTADATITLDDAEAKVLAATSKTASLKINLPKTGVTDAMLTDVSGGATAKVADGKVVVSFTGATIEPKEFTFDVDNKFSGKEFSLKINEIEISGKFTEEGKAPEITAAEGGNVVLSTATSATISMALNGAAITADSVKDPSANIETAVENGVIKINFKDTDESGNLAKPWSYEIKVSDSSTEKYPPAGYSSVYDFWSELKEGDKSNIKRLPVFISDDEFLTIKSNTEDEAGMFYRHDSAHGLAAYNGNTFEVKVAGNAGVTFTGCAYGPSCVIEASVKDPSKGTISPERSEDINDPEHVADGKQAVFSYTGEATTLIFTVSSPGECYLHNMSVANEKAASAGNGKIDVWDFGAAVLDAEKYNNLLTVDFLNGLYDGAAPGSKGPTFPAKFEAGDLAYNGKPNSNRLRTTNKALTRYDEGNSVGSIKGFNCTDLGIAGCLYLNGSSGAAQGVFTISLLKDDVVYVYIKMDSSADVLEFTKAGTTNTKSVPVSMDGSVAKFVAPEDGSYTIMDTNEAGKARYYRIVREHAKYVKVSGSIDTSAATDLPANYSVIARNEETKSETEIIPKDGSYEAMLPTGYTYTFRLNNAIGFRMSEGTKIENLAADTANNMTIVPVDYHTASGKVFGLADDLAGKVKLTYEPKDADDKLSYGAAEVVITTGAAVDADSKLSVSYSVKLADNVSYILVLEGANDYKIASGGEITATADVTADIKFDPKETYEAKGKFVTSTGASIDVSEMVLTRLSDNYTYTPAIADGGYSIKLVNGVYKVDATIPEGAPYKQATHIVVNGEAVEKDVYFVSTAPKKAEYVADIYVDNEAGDNHFATLKEALEYVNAMPAADNDNRVTIHIAPGTYRAQHILKRPNVSLVNTDPTKEVKLTWYYGIGYKYYSAGADGYYNELNAVDKYLKNGKDTEKTANVARWGGAFNINSTATDFYAENIFFESSFNKYITEEEIADGVAPSGAEGIRYDRTSPTADAKSRAATERAAAIIVEGDRGEFYKCKFSSSQDTLYINPQIREYFKDCFVEGMTDYIFGDGQVVFEDCTLNFCGYSDSTAGGHLTATKYDYGGKGYLFYDCIVTATNEGTIKPSKESDFGRPWGPTSTVTYFNTTVYGDIITKRGYTDMSGAKPEAANYKEYNTKRDDGTALITSASKKMTDEEAAALKVKDWFGIDWTPIHYVEKVTWDPNVRYGDTDENNRITAADASLALLYALDANKRGSEESRKAADVDGDGIITANDAVIILQKVLDNSVEFPIERRKPANK